MNSIDAEKYLKKETDSIPNSEKSIINQMNIIK